MDVSFLAGRSARIRPEDWVDKFSLCENQTPRFGYWWWEWLPKVHICFGNPLRGRTFSVDVSWLCFYATMLVWP